MEVASFVEKSLNDRSNSMYLNKVSNIVKVQRQLVNGINYKVSTCTNVYTTKMLAHVHIYTYIYTHVQIYTT